MSFTTISNFGTLAGYSLVLSTTPSAMPGSTPPILGMSTQLSTYAGGGNWGVVTLRELFGHGITFATSNGNTIYNDFSSNGTAGKNYIVIMFFDNVNNLYKTTIYTMTNGILSIVGNSKSVAVSSWTSFSSITSMEIGHWATWVTDSYVGTFDKIALFNGDLAMSTSLSTYISSLLASGPNSVSGSTYTFAVSTDFNPVSVNLINSPTATTSNVSLTFTGGNNLAGAHYMTLKSYGTVFTGGGGGGGVACFVSGTRILSQNGYKPIEEFTREDLLVTSDNRTIDFKLHKTTIAKTDEETAPYVILPHAFGRNKPLAPLYLSPTHKIQIRKGLWTSPQTASKTNALITRMPFGQSVTYYHIECENYLRDNVIAEGLVAESYGIMVAKKAVGKFYTWSQKLGGYTRQGYAVINNTISNI